MGSSRSDAECGVGSIVWVRRRNGSWWPGKILGSDELPSSHTTSSRSGTPVKLLGREDASVDWYNLEKSKRVKAFRCGEFDDCIEKAESSQGMPTKKREKYARREDAILHALELERKLLKEQGKLSDDVRNNSYETMEKELATASEILESDNGESRSSETLKSRNVQSENFSQMRDLQDTGFQNSPSKRKLSSIPSRAPPSNNDQNLQSDFSPESMSHENGGEKTGENSRGKRTRYVNSPIASNGSLNPKKNPFSPVEMSASHLEDNHTHPVSSAEVDSSQHNEDSELDSTEDELDRDRDGGTSIYSDVSTPEGAKLNSLRRLKSASSEELSESSFSGETSNPYATDPFSPNEAVSKWQSKRKRNIRSFKRRSPDAFSNFIFFRNKNLVDNDDDTDFDAKDMWGSQMDDLDNGEPPFTPKFVSKHRFGSAHRLADWESTWEDQMGLKGHWEERTERLYPTYVDHTHIGGKRKLMLYEVDLKVQGAGYQREPVPLISLMSKVNGKAIIGHPIHIEALENDSTEKFLTSCDPQPAWKTARRTANSRAPRPSLPSLDDEEYSEENFLSDQEWKAPRKKSSSGGSNKKGNQMRTSRKVPTKTSVASNQKTRTLTSIASEKRVGNSQNDGFTKPEYTGPITVACIPSKLVFSRLFQKLK